jgi:hypothetical protein
MDEPMANRYAKNVPRRFPDLNLATTSAARINDLIPVLLNDPLEMTLPDGRGFLRFRDLETGKVQCVRLSQKNRFKYAEFLRTQRRDLIKEFYRYGLDFQEIKTDEPFFELLYSLFLMRKR